MKIVFRNSINGAHIISTDLAPNGGNGYYEQLGIIPSVGDIVLLPLPINGLKETKACKVVQRVISVFNNECTVFVTKVTKNDYCLAEHVKKGTM